MGFPLEEAPLTADGNRSVRVGQVSKQNFKMGQTTRDPKECGKRFSSFFDRVFHLLFFFPIKYVILFQNSTLVPGNNRVVGNVSCHWQLLKTDWEGAEIRHAARDSGKDYIGLNGNKQGNGKDARYQHSWIIQPYKVSQACLKMQNVVHTRQNACPYLPEIPNIKESGRKKK